MYDQRFRPMVGHWSDSTLIDQHGTLFATFQVGGLNYELLDEGANRISRDIYNQLALNTHSTRLEWWQHFTRVSRQKMPPLPECGSWWAREFDAAHQARCFDNLYRNDLFFTVGLRQEAGFNLFNRDTRPSRLFEEEFEDLVSKTLANLKPFGPRRLGVRNDPVRGLCSQIAEAHHLVGNGFFRPIPLPDPRQKWTRIGRQICPVRPIFGHRDGQLLTEGFESWFAIFGFINYPGQTHPGMFEDIRSADFDLTITNSFLPVQTTKAIKNLESKQGQLAAANDSMREQQRLREKQEDLKDNTEVFGKHHFSLTIRARSQRELDTCAWKVDDLVAKSRATVARYDAKSLKSAFYAQFPGNRRWRVRTGGVSSINFASYAALNNVPTGRDKSRWGAPLFYIRTTKDTLVPMHYHVLDDPNIPAEDVGSYFTLGGMGRGKTSIANAKDAFASRVGARIVKFDKDCGAAPFIKACGGEYIVFEDGTPTGVAPLRAPDATPDHLHDFILGIIESDGKGKVSATDDTDLSEQIRFQLSLPADLRAIDGIWPMLDQREGGAGERLRKWGRGQRLGWAFDGTRDQVPIGASLLGFDTTKLLENPTVCEPMLIELFHRLQAIVYLRKPLVISMDECWQTIGKNPGAAVDNKRMVHVMDNHSRTIRKNEGIIGLITQNGSALLNSTMATTIVQNFPTKEFFGDSTLTKEVAEGFGLTPKEANIVRRQLPLMTGSLLVKQGERSFIGRNDMSKLPEYLSVLSGRRVTYELIGVLEKKYGTDPQAWVPHYQHYAPMIVANPHLDPHDLVYGQPELAMAAE